MDTDILLIDCSMCLCDSVRTRRLHNLFRHSAKRRGEPDNDPPLTVTANQTVSQHIQEKVKLAFVREVGKALYTLLLS